MIGHPVLTVEHRCCFIQADIAEGNSSTAAVIEHIYVVGRLQAPEGTMLKQGRSVDRSRLFAALDAELQGFMGNFHALAEKLPEAVFITVRFQGNTRNVDCYHTEIKS